MAPIYKPVPNDVIKKLLQGKYVTLDKLFRQAQDMRSARVSRHSVVLAKGLQLQTEAPPPRRYVNNEHDWCEVMFSSILPALSQSVLSSTTITDAHTAATKLQQHLCYCLAAITYFIQCCPLQHQ